MSYCTNCIHHKVCGNEGIDDSSMTFCADKQEERPTGVWILFDEEANVYECSNCKEPFILMVGTPKENNYNYCPNCGARMKESESKE